MSYNETFDLKAPAATVFDALIDQQTLESGLAQNVRIDPYKGGAFRFWGHTERPHAASDLEGEDWVPRGGGPTLRPDRAECERAGLTVSCRWTR